jgi:hypothetical protein
MHLSLSDFVYLLRMHDSSDFKIGVSMDVQARASSLPENINLAESLCVECTILSARKIEQLLHSMFHQFRLETHCGDGRTEWFDGGCFERVRDFIATHCSLLRCSAPKPVPDIPQLLSAGTRVTREEARRRRQEEWEAAKARSIEVGSAVLGNCLALLRAAVLRGALKGRGHWKNRYGRREEFIVFVPAQESLILPKLIPLLDELNLLLDSIPLLSAYALRAGRTALRKAEADFDELLSA